MAASNLTYFLKSLNQKAEKESQNGTEVLFSVSIMTGNKSQKVIEKEPFEFMTKQVNHIVRTEKPEIIKVDLLTDSGRWIDGNVCDLRPKAEPHPQFQGFGEAEISSIVEKRLQEIKKVEEYNEMKEIVKELSNENETLKAKVEELENTNESLEEELENKSQIKYYTGMLGDILESIGIPKTRIKKPIAALMGIKDEKEDEQSKRSAAKDESGIVDETKESKKEQITDEEKRTEVINVISYFLKTLDNQLLGELYTIFSEVETNHDLAAEIIEYINKRKEFQQ
jgi:hypothetical protein